MNLLKRGLIPSYDSIMNASALDYLSGISTYFYLSFNFGPFLKYFSKNDLMLCHLLSSKSGEKNNLFVAPRRRAFWFYLFLYTSNKLFRLTASLGLVNLSITMGTVLEAANSHSAPSSMRNFRSSVEELIRTKIRSSSSYIF